MLVTVTRLDGIDADDFARWNPGVAINVHVGKPGCGLTGCVNEGKGSEFGECRCVPPTGGRHLRIVE